MIELVIRATLTRTAAISIAGRTRAKRIVRATCRKENADNQQHHENLNTQPETGLLDKIHHEQALLLTLDFFVTIYL
jgi:acetyl-CoA carboxylase beta subunit